MSDPVEEATDVFPERYAPRSGIESTNSGLKNRLGLGRLRVRGRGSVYRVIWHKVTGWNVLRAAASRTLRAQVRAAVARTLNGSEVGQTGVFSTADLQRGAGFWLDAWASHGRSDRLGALRAA